MAMTYASLIAAKGTSGSIANWVAYTKLDLPPIVDEAQALLYMRLRVREMRTSTAFAVPQSGDRLALPTGFLDPIGRIFVPTINLSIAHKDQGYVERARTYQETSGTLGASPLTTTNGSSQVTVNQPLHGFNQGSNIFLSGAAAVNGITANGTFDVVQIVDPNNFVIDTLTQTASGSGSGGGSAIAYTCDSLVQGNPQYWGIWSETIYFDFAFAQQLLCRLAYYRSLPLLSSTNQSNFLTSRYPQLMRCACTTAAADFMKDTEEYEKGVTRLGSMINDVMAENDGVYRGIEVESETP